MAVGGGIQKVQEGLKGLKKAKRRKTKGKKD